LLTVLKILRYEKSSEPNSNGNTRFARPTLPPPDALPDAEILPEVHFMKMLCVERKRTERSRRPFVLMLLESAGLLKPGANEDTLRKVLRALTRSTRATDVIGWYREGSVFGVIFTEIGPIEEGHAAAKTLLAKVTHALSNTLRLDQINQIRLSFHVFPEDWESEGTGRPADSTLYPDLKRDLDPRRAARIVKRATDILGSSMALIVFLPLLALIAILIKLTSKGPVLFRQDRLGQNGIPFKFLKFRSMYVNSDPKIHEDYTRRLIEGSASAEAVKGSDTKVYKLTSDPRVSPIGRFLRRTSLDELPQFWNVLIGEMSLVGPRPPIPYEVRAYDLWHKGRLLTATPGITGLWQVGGRSAVKFDDMVRMDLEYARSWSLWLDLKILWRTPRAVLMGNGAY
jgi:lipopolysaccharide/colanic/teichoic acid biosynthesis glycosyltransferase